jgi:acetyl esterase/lipase
MRVSAIPEFDIDVEDVSFLRRGGEDLRATVMMPRGEGPFPAAVSVHGGAWYLNDRTHRNATKRRLARHGVVVVAIDFRMPPVATYPAALADINYAVRWVKANSAQLRTSPLLVGIQGESSGGHLAVLSSTRPHDPRYAIEGNPSDWPSVDATVGWVLAFWPVISPLGRYHFAKDQLSQGKPSIVIPGHEQFWVTEDAMAEGDPVLALERGETLVTPPTLCFQGSNDRGHPRPHLERFAQLYREAGGEIDVEIITLPEGVNLGQTVEDEPDGPLADTMMVRIAEFVDKHTPPGAGRQ